MGPGFSLGAPAAVIANQTVDLSLGFGDEMGCFPLGFLLLFLMN